MAKVVHIIIAIVAVFAAIYLIGATLGSTFLVSCTSIKEFKQCWKITPDYVDSEFCTSSRPCLAQPEDMQHNAIVSMLMSACTKAKTDGYADEALVTRIKSVSNVFLGYSLSAAQLCEQPGAVLVYRSYD